MAGDKDSGVTTSRTLIPNLPPEYLSRRHLFPLIDNESSGTTFVIAPAGYGKTTLVSEWAQNQEKKIIWMTVTNGDTTNEMSAMLIAATRRVIPNFAPWFEREQPIRATDVVRRWGNELVNTSQEFIFVLDNLRNPEDEDVDIAVQLIQQFPQNMHFVAIRSTPIEGIYGVCSSRGPVKVVTTSDLRFAEDEIEQLAKNLNIEISEASLKLLHAGSGWPAATSLLVAYLQGKGEISGIEKILSSDVEPLRSLVLIVIDGLGGEVSEMCEKLSVLEVFTLEDAKVILGEDYSFELINAVAHKGEIFAPLRDARVGYSFSPMVRQVCLERLGYRGDLARQLHERLVTHFENQGDPSSAINHAFQAGNQEKISELFPNAARVKQAQGRGGELLRWSIFASYSPQDGDLKRSTVAITGHLADLDFSAAASEISKMNLLAPNSETPEFFYQFVAGASIYSAITLGKFNEVERLFERTKAGTSDCYLGVDDQINLVRLLAGKRYIWNEAEGVEAAYELSQKMGKETTLFTSHAFLNSIHAMHLHQRGEYRRAFEIANIAFDQLTKNGCVGNHGPLDAKFIIARCLLEFSRPREALTQLERVRDKALQWKQWHWYLTVEKHIIENLAYSEMHGEAFERVKLSRDLVASISSVNELSDFVDISELAIRRKVGDFDRLEKLVERAPKIRDTFQYKMAVDEFRGRKALHQDAKNLAEKTPRDQIWKYLTEATLNIDSEKIAMQAIQKALKIGSEVGAKETFLRQRNEMGNYIIKIANSFPTVYNEELAAATADRIKERETLMTAEHQTLTKRELEILRQLSTGRTLTVIAGELHISQNTMKTHLKNLYRKLGADGRHDAVEKARDSFIL
jgi:ATP/maltotriose-dependent transcriptional regulator MalT